VTTDEYLQETAHTAQPTPVAPNGRCLSIKISLYEDGAAIDAKRCTGLHLGSDAKVVDGVATVMQKVRSRMTAS
jgi:hypothetical protein